MTSATHYDHPYYHSPVSDHAYDLLQEMARQALVVRHEGENVLVATLSDEWLDKLAELGSDNDGLEDDNVDCCAAADDDPTHRHGDMSPGDPDDAEDEPDCCSAADDDPTWHFSDGRPGYEEDAQLEHEG
jgi:hypothetical protein